MGVAHLVEQRHQLAVEDRQLAVKQAVHLAAFPVHQVVPHHGEHHVALRVVVGDVDGQHALHVVQVPHVLGGEAGGEGVLVPLDAREGVLLRRPGHVGLRVLAPAQVVGLPVQHGGDLRKEALPRRLGRRRGGDGVPAAAEPGGVGLHEAEPVGHVEGEVQPVHIFLKLVLGVLGDQHRQSAAGVQVVRLAVDEHRPGQALARPRGQVGVEFGVGVQHGGHVHHVPAPVHEGAEGVHAAAPAAHVRPVALVELAHQSCGELLKHVLEVPHARQIDGAQRQVVVRGVREGRVHVGVHDHAAQRVAGHAGVVVQRLEPGGVVPAEARLQLLAGDVIVDVVIGQHGGHLVGGHHAGVAAEHVDVKAAQVLAQIVEHVVDLDQGQAVLVPGGVVEAHPRLGARAVVPQYDHRAVRGERGQPVLQKLQQAVPAAHGLLAPVLQRLDVAVPQGHQRAPAALELVDVPRLRAARQDRHVDVLARLRQRHLVDVLAGLRLDARPGHVHQHRGRLRPGRRKGARHQQQ